MNTTAEKGPRKMPKGGRKGGSVFPRVSLSDAIRYAKKLVSKTHTAAQPQDVLYSGVVGAKSGTGAVRLSALKQFGFLVGDVKSGFSASDLATKLAASPADEVTPLYREAVLKPTVFKKIFDTFHGDAVSKAKLKQRAADLKVHPDETASCVDLYVAGMQTAQLVTVDGELVRHLLAKDVIGAGDQSLLAEQAAEERAEDVDDAELDDTEAHDAKEMSSGHSGVAEPRTSSQNQSAQRARQSGPRAVFNVNVSLDSSLDIEKLQKQLELLKRFGAI